MTYEPKYYTIVLLQKWSFMEIYSPLFTYSLPLSDSGQLKHYDQQSSVLDIEGLAL